MRWWAGRGLGAFRDGDRISVSSVSALDDAQLSFAWDTTERFDADGIGDKLIALSHRCWRTRGIGDFWQHVLVAEGAFDIAVDPIVALWDIAALVPIIEEAGGRWSTIDGRARRRRRQLRVHQRVAPRRSARGARVTSRSADARDGLTVGIDIGTSSVKAVAADADGNVVARSRIPHEFYVPDARSASSTMPPSRGTTGRNARSKRSATSSPRGVSVAAMVPSLTAVDDDGVPIAPGLLYGDERGHGDRETAIAEAGELAQFLRWQRTERPDARGYWMAQAVANHALSGNADRRRPSSPRPRTRCSTGRPGTTKLLAECGARPDQMPLIGPSRVRRSPRCTGYADCVLEGGTIDAIGEQLVAGADDVGDVLVILGTTLIVWAVMPEPVEVPNYYTIPHTARGQVSRRWPEQRGWAVPQLGRPHAGRGTRRGRSGTRAGVGAVPARGAGAVPGLVATRGARRSRSHARRCGGTTRHVRGDGVRRRAA